MSQILAVLAVLVLSLFLFISEKIRPDLVALLILVILAVLGLVTPQEAISGFSNPAVVTVWAVLILSQGLARSGTANIVSDRLLQIAGDGETRLIIVIMLAVGVLSSFMNNIGATSLMLPVVIALARRTHRAPSKLLMPLAFAGLMGGMATLIGTPPNILVSESLQEAGLPPLRMFDFVPTGIAVLIGGVVFMAFIGRRLLPERDMRSGALAEDDDDLEEAYALKKRLFVLHLSQETPLGGKSLAEIGLGATLGINILAILRPGSDQLAPGPNAMVQGGDRLLVLGKRAGLEALQSHHPLTFASEQPNVEAVLESGSQYSRVEIHTGSKLLGTTLRQSNFRHSFGLNVLAIWRSGKPHRTRLHDVELAEGDVLLVQGPEARVQRLRSEPGLHVSDAEASDIHMISERVFTVRIPQDSALSDKTLQESRLADTYGLSVLGIVRRGQTRLLPPAEERLEAGDTLLVEGRPEGLLFLEGSDDLEIEYQAEVDLASLGDGDIGLSEVVLSPRTHLVGKNLRQIRFRDKYGLNVVALMRAGRAFRSNLGDLTLQFGDALLLFGQRYRLRVLATDPDFLVLEEGLQDPPRYEKAPLAALIMAVALVPAIFGWLSIAVSLIMGVVLMIISGCLTMEEAYRAVEWKAIFLIAGMLPLGIAMQTTGAAAFLAESMIRLVGSFGPMAVLVALFLLTAVASQSMPNAAVAVLLAPIALSAGSDLGVSPYPLVMAVAVSASAAFLSPVGHPANLLVMGPGGYQFKDFIKVGAPMLGVVLLISMLAIPLVWPF
jgi:di/tricarboxylate transporter